MKRTKKVKNPMAKFEKALRGLWRWSAERKSHIKAVLYKDPKTGANFFKCPDCGTAWPEAMADVDHEPRLGGLQAFDQIQDYVNRLYFGPQKALCKLCHKKKTAAERKKK